MAGQEGSHGVGPGQPRSIVAVARIVAAGCIVGLLLGSGPMVDWVEAKPTLPDWVGHAAREWNAALSMTGLAQLHPWVRQAVEAARGQRDG